MNAMKKINPKAVWVAQAWQDNPRTKMIENLKTGDLLILDLHSECRPQWGDTSSEWYRKNGYGQHNWITACYLTLAEMSDYMGKWMP